MMKAILLAIVLALVAQEAVGGYDRVLLRDVQALTLKKGQYTTGRRVSSVPQLKCVANCVYEPEVLQCTNRGHDGTDYQWKCEGNMPNGVNLGTTTVTCEGYDYPDDPYILRGSCGVEYTLTTSAAYQRAHPESSSWFRRMGTRMGSWFGGQNPTEPADGHSSAFEHYYGTQASSSFSLFPLVIAAFVAYALYKLCIARPPLPEGRGFFGRGGWFPWSGAGDATGAGAGGSGLYPGPSEYYGTSAAACAPTAPAASTGWLGNAGFWTGAGLGGLAGYLLRGRQRAAPAPAPVRVVQVERERSHTPVEEVHQSAGYGGTRRR